MPFFERLVLCFLPQYDSVSFGPFLHVNLFLSFDITFISSAIFSNDTCIMLCAAQYKVGPKILWYSVLWHLLYRTLYRGVLSFCLSTWTLDVKKT
jgi:hypothetical protein